MIARYADAALSREPSIGQRAAKAGFERRIKARFSPCLDEVAGKKQICFRESALLGNKVVEESATDELGLFRPIGSEVQVGKVKEVMSHCSLGNLIVCLRPPCTRGPEPAPNWAIKLSAAHAAEAAVGVAAARFVSTASSRCGRG